MNKKKLYLFIGAFFLRLTILLEVLIGGSLKERLEKKWLKRVPVAKSVSIYLSFHAIGFLMNSERKAVNKFT